MEITLQVNGRERTWETAPGELLIDTLRRNGCYGVKRGCETGDCGACAVLLDGRAVNPCVTFTGSAAGREILTIEGLAPPKGLHPIQQAFHECHALQCGFCTPGFIMSVMTYFEENENPDLSDAGIRAALSGNLCRCTGYQNIVKAVRRAHELMSEA